MKTIKKILVLLLCLLVASINFNLVLKPLNLVVGGTQGIALIISNIFNIKPYIIILSINIVMLLLSLIFLGKKTTYGIIIATFIYPLFVKYTSFLNMINISDINIFFSIIITGIVSGLTNGYILKLGYSTGGINILILLLKKYLKIKESTSIFVLNTIIIIIGSIFFGINKAIYSIIIVIINSIIVNKVIYKNKNMI